MTVPYQIREDVTGFYIIRPCVGGGILTVAGPYLTRYEAEVVARRRWAASGRRAA